MPCAAQPNVTALIKHACRWLLQGDESYAAAVQRNASLSAVQFQERTRQKVVLQEVNRLLLLSAGGDGFIRVWLITATGRLLCGLKGAHLEGDYVCAVNTNPNYSYVAIGDTSGHVRVWDVSAGIDISTPKACSRSFVEIVSGTIRNIETAIAV